MLRIMFWGLFSLTLAIYAVMLAWSLPLLATSAGGLTPFDMRPGGYSFAEAHSFLTALSTEGAEFYRSVQQRLDLFYPGLIAGTLFFSLAALLPRQFGSWRWIVAVIALPVGVFDYLENHAIAAMIDVGAAGLTPNLVESASQWTVLKATASTAAMSIVLLLPLWRTGRRLLPKVRIVLAGRPVVSFVVLALGLSAVVQVIAVSVGLSMLMASSISMMLGLALPALLVTAAESGWVGVWRFVHRAVLNRVSIRLLVLAALGLPAAMILIASLLQGGEPLARLMTDWPRLFTSFLPELLLMFLAIQLFEEFAWTGFLQHRLQERFGALVASLIVAPVFALSHLMLNYLGSGELAATLAMLAVQIAFATFFRVTITALTNLAGGSILAAALFHAAFNAANGELFEGVIGGSHATWLPLVVVVGVALAVIVVTRGSLRFIRSTDERQHEVLQTA